jgi:hypothetical protein
MKTVKEISKYLFEKDWMCTCCVENDMYDEYLDIATYIHSIEHQITIIYLHSNHKA